ncbi:MAG: hypothetical protein ABFR65_11530 [Pseudomonadota bacterium]
MELPVIVDAMTHFGVDDMEALMQVLEEQHADGQCEATDGCCVEPDGQCPHGCSSWLVKLGLI